MRGTVWRLQGIDTADKDLILSRIVPWTADGPASVESITSSFPAVSGSVGNLLNDDSSFCVFDAEDVRKPGFYIEFSFSAEVECWGFRFAAPAFNNWPLRHTVVVGREAASVLMPPWLEDALSPEQTRPLRAIEAGVWVEYAGLGVRNWKFSAISSDGMVVLVGAPGYTALSTDGGGSWRVVDEASLTGLEGGAVSADGNVLVVVSGGTLGVACVSKDRGVTWSTSSTLTGGNFGCCALSADGQVMLVGRGVATSLPLLLSIDGGASWTSVSAAGNRYWRRCAVSHDGLTLLAVASTSSVPFLSKDGGLTWVAQSAVGSTAWYGAAVSASGGTLLIGGSTSGYLRLSTDGGSTWTTPSIAAGRTWSACAVSADGQTLMAGTGTAAASANYVFMSRDGGITWEPQTTVGMRQWVGAAASADGAQRIAVSTTASAGRVFLAEDPDSIYIAPPVNHIARRDRFVTGIDPALPPSPPQGEVIAKTLSPKALDSECGGNAAINGVVELYTQSGNIPLPRRVRLHRSRDGLLVRETWSNAQGEYRFDGITDRYKYDVIAWDHEGMQQSVVANDLTPEVMP